MRYAVKNRRKTVRAYELGAGTEVEAELRKTGRIKLEEDGSYRLFSQEATDGEGEKACRGDFFKFDEIDGVKYPYPNTRQFFLENHTHLQGDEYLQVGKPLPFWKKGDPQPEEIRYLLKTGRLTIKENDPDHYYNAFLFQAPLSAPEDAAVLIYSVERDGQGNITDIDFNLIQPANFESDYQVVGWPGEE